MTSTDANGPSTSRDQGVRRDVSIIIPVYNSETTLETLIAEIVKAMEACGRSFEVVLVDDGSRDRSWATLCELQQSHPDWLKVIRLMRNYGQHNALMCALHHSNGAYVVTMDDDLQNPPSEIPKLLEAIERRSLDLVYGRYGSKQHHQVRNLGSTLATFFFRTIFRLQVSPTSFRIMTEQLARSVLGYDLNFTYLDGLLAWNTDRVGLVDVEHRTRAAGKSGYSFGKLLLFSLNLFTNFSLLPLQMASLIGGFAAIMGFVVGLFYVIQYFLANISVPGFAALITAILVLGGTQLLALGVIGEYVGRMHLNVNKKPQFSVRQVLGGTHQQSGLRTGEVEAAETSREGAVGRPP